MGIVWRPESFHVGLPYTCPPDVAGRLLLQKGADLLHLAPACGSIVKQITELTGVWLDIDGTLGGPRKAVQNEDLVFGATFLA